MPKRGRAKKTEKTIAQPVKKVFYTYCALALLAILDFAFLNAATLLSTLESSALSLGISMQEQAAHLTALALFDVLAFVGAALSAAAIARNDAQRLREYSLIAFLGFAGAGAYLLAAGKSGVPSAQSIAYIALGILAVLIAFRMKKSNDF